MISHLPGLSATKAMCLVPGLRDDHAVAPIGLPAAVEVVQHPHDMALHMNDLRNQVLLPGQADGEPFFTENRGGPSICG